LVANLSFTSHGECPSWPRCLLMVLLFASFPPPLGLEFPPSQTPPLLLDLITLLIRYPPFLQFLTPLLFLRILITLNPFFSSLSVVKLFSRIPPPLSGRSGSPPRGFQPSSSLPSSPFHFFFLQLTERCDPTLSFACTKKPGIYALSGPSPQAREPWTYLWSDLDF